MKDFLLLEEIRRNERQSHEEVYTTNSLYQPGSWLSKPVKTVLELFPYFEGRRNLRVLDLGCGVGRNCIAIAQHFCDADCKIDCVDILDLAVEKLLKNAALFGVAESITGIIRPIDNYRIPEEYYDWILAISALEHMDSHTSFVGKLSEIRDGLKENGIVCLIINSGTEERLISTGEKVPVNFEVNFQTSELQELLNSVFADFRILKSTVRRQNYEVPRGSEQCALCSDVVTFVAQK